MSTSPASLSTPPEGYDDWLAELKQQIHRYSKESFNSDNSLYKYLQIFVISNGTDTRYFANTTKRDKHSFDFTIHWATEDNKPIKDLKGFTATFLQKHTLLAVLLRYSVFDIHNTLLVMRPYQIAATERMLRKLNSSYLAKNWSKPERWWLHLAHHRIGQNADQF